jgi:hypothetical protein
LKRRSGVTQAQKRAAMMRRFMAAFLRIAEKDRPGPPSVTRAYDMTHLCHKPGGGGDRDSAVQQPIGLSLLVLSFGQAQEEANRRPCVASGDARLSRCSEVRWHGHLPRAQRRALPVIGHLSSRTADSDPSMLVSVAVVFVTLAMPKAVAIPLHKCRYDRLVCPADAADRRRTPLRPESVCRGTARLVSATKEEQNRP